MATHPLRRESATQAVPGNGVVSQARTVPGSEPGWIAASGMATQLLVMAGLLGGLWVAISPWFLTLQARGSNATADDLIIGLAVVALALFTAAGGRGAISLQAASALAGVWLIISPFILDAKFPVTGAMYWSNIWAGGIIIVLALGVFASGRLRAAR